MHFVSYKRHIYVMLHVLLQDKIFRPQHRSVGKLTGEGVGFLHNGKGATWPPVNSGHMSYVGLLGQDRIAFREGAESGITFWKGLVT